MHDMELVSFEHSALSLVPPAIAIILAVLTRRVLVSLGVGILVGSLMLCGFSPVQTASYLGSTALGLIWDGGAPNTWNLYIILFLILLGIMTSCISASGGSKAFGDWAMERVRTRRGASLLTVFLGIFIFIDDYFNSLAVGSISRPLTDRHGISRAKLAYIIDSTAAPICVISPISSWGAYIIALIGSVLAAHEFAPHTPLGAFLQMVPMNFYALFTMLFVGYIVWSGNDFGPMRRHEAKARAGEMLGATRPPEMDLAMADGKVRDLVLPILVLIAGTTLAMLFTGYAALKGDGQSFSILGAFENTDVAKSLVYGGLSGLAAILALMAGATLPSDAYLNSFKDGTKSMLPAIYILLFAWTIITVIKALKTGAFLASQIDGTIPPAMLPLLLFVLSGIMAFATGTSWGTFGIMLPIAGDIAAASAPELILPVLAAVLAGAVLGDHCSPISDTTILSSTGAACNHIDHVTTQLPYALTAAFIASCGYIALGFAGSVLAGLLASAGAMALCVAIIRIKASGATSGL